MSDTKPEELPFLDGKLLVAMPGLGDPRFEHTVIFTCAHTPEGAMGLIINKLAESLLFNDLLVQLEISSDGRLDRPEVHLGGPVEHGRGFVLHSPEYHVEDSTMAICDDFSMTATLEVLRDIGQSRGPKDALLALGYSGWGPGQLESEIQHNGWLIADSTPDLVFHCPAEKKWTEAVKSLGFDPNMLAAVGGTA